MSEARRARADDLELLLALFAASEVSAVAAPIKHAARIWAEMLSSPNLTIFVTDAGGLIAATCTLITAPNLLRGGRGFGFLENVVSHSSYRGQGHGRAVVRAVLAEAWARDCHHVLLQSGRKDPRVHRFYEGCGFEAGVRTGYVAHRPK